eukprot:6212764-Pleurochrysis_carterae.AAC.4
MGKAERRRNASKRARAISMPIHGAWVAHRMGTSSRLLLPPSPSGPGDPKSDADRLCDSATAELTRTTCTTCAHALQEPSSSSSQRRERGRSPAPSCARRSRFARRSLDSTRAKAFATYQAECAHPCRPASKHGPELAVLVASA